MLKSALGQTSLRAPNCLVSGWGQTGFNIYDAPTTILKQVYVPIVSGNECKASFQRQAQGAQIVSTYLDVDGGNELCAGGQAQLDACTVSLLLNWQTLTY